MTLPAQSTALVLTALWLAGCDHTPPFASSIPLPGTPLVPGLPARVTYSPAADVKPRWLPDGSGFFYTVERNDRADRDQCLARMAPTGGAIVELICDHSPTTDDSIATFEWAAVDADDRMAYVRTGAPVSPPTLAPRTVELRLGTSAEPGGVLVRSFPFTAPSGRMHQGLGWVQWLDAERLAYVGEEVRYEAPCAGCFPDTLRIGLEVVTVDVATGAVQSIPGTDSANAFALVGSDTMYYTRASSNVIERRILSTGAVAVVYDFGAPALDVAEGGGVLAAISGGLWLVRPGSPAEQLTAPVLTQFRRPAVSPDGRRLVAEGYAFSVDTVRMNGMIIAIDTSVSNVSDLWLFQLP